ncbi:hybrid-cluster NAD(P)-dependent oxidoreductase [uncultured Aquitalea sp.]|uniref:hybrid-cluster NAD(P)-dependent oxidoreductase n=1 Tax=uncultured Aquitalea sp. TaxID=540272 RepID=UPI0025D5CDF0|nr:hybrid-cluster NAD(P)-dependent oxidoreductase [uncultured Aquitalea sp.]
MSEQKHSHPSSPLPADDLPLWQPGEDSTLECVQVREETHDVKTFVFRAEPPRRFHYQPGQFLTLELEIDGEAVNRCYTLSSTPTRPDRVSITVKRIPGGKVSGWLHEQLRPGQRINVLGPSGEFTCARHAASPYLFLSAGSGITPLMSMTRALTDLSTGADIVFIHSARSPRDIIFRKELALLSASHATFTQAIICENRAGEPEWPGFIGRLDAARLQGMVPDLLARQVFCCGPAPYMASVRALLQECGFDMNRYHEESFNFAELNAAPPDEVVESASPSEEGTGFNVHFAKMGDDLSVAPGQTVLAAALAKGMRLPASCTRGVCGTCKTRLLEGKVDMKHEGGIRQREVDQGYFLPCCSKPLTDLVLDR